MTRQVVAVVPEKGQVTKGKDLVVCVRALDTEKAPRAVIVEEKMTEGGREKIVGGSEQWDLQHT